MSKANKDSRPGSGQEPPEFKWEALLHKPAWSVSRSFIVLFIYLCTDTNLNLRNQKKVTLTKSSVEKYPYRNETHILEWYVEKHLVLLTRLCIKQPFQCMHLQQLRPHFTINSFCFVFWRVVSQICYPMNHSLRKCNDWCTKDLTDFKTKLFPEIYLQWQVEFLPSGAYCYHSNNVFEECHHLGCGAVQILWSRDRVLRNIYSFHRIYTAPHPKRRHSS
jgi:hypothetical protein